MIDYLSSLFELYLSKILNNLMIITYNYISDNLNDKIKEFNILNNEINNLLN